MAHWQDSYDFDGAAYPGDIRPGRQSHSDATLCISLAFIRTERARSRQNGFNVSVKVTGLAQKF